MAKTAHKRKTTKRTSSKAGGTKKETPKKSPHRWSRKVTKTSDAMDLKEGIFTSDDPKKIAASLKKSAGRSHRRKASPFQSAMSMLNFYINRGGENITASHRKVLEEAKDELRKLFDREE